jgi:hypothetical protein
MRTPMGSFHILSGCQCVDAADFIQAVGDENALSQCFFQTIVTFSRGRIINMV